MRPSDWFLVQLPSDPVPGDAFGVRTLAAKYQAIADIAGDAADGVHRARTSGAASAWVGDAGDIFRERSHRMPGELRRADDSYSRVADALTVWASAVDDTQAQADRGLQQAREAAADLASATAALDQAQASWSTVHAQQLGFQKLQKDYASVPPPPNVTMPTADELRRASRNAAQSQASIADSQRRIADADARLAAARALVLDAKSRRDDAEQRVVTRIGEAADHAVKPSSVWEAIQDSAAWQVLVQVATVVLTIVSIIAIFVGGPLVWALILAATILLVVNALLSIAQGKDAWGELALLAIGLIPGGRLLGVAIRGLGSMGRVGAAALRVGDVVGRIASRLRELTQRLASGLRDGVATVVRRLADDTGELDFAAFLQRRSPHETQLSQKTVSFSKKDRITGERYTYEDILTSMRADGWKGDHIDVVDFGQEGITSLDNTRIVAAREAGIDVEAMVHHPDQPLTPGEVDRFTPENSTVVPETWGDAVKLRIDGQGAAWARENPYGTLESPRITGRPQ